MRAVELGLPSIAFTDHADFTRWTIGPGIAAHMVPAQVARIGPDGMFTPPPLDVGSYLACVQRCRERFPGLRVLSGAELGEPHWHEDQVTSLLEAGLFDRVLGSVHSVVADGTQMVDLLVGHLEPADLMRAYLAEALRLASSPAPFEVLAHIDYPVRYWPATADRFDPADFEDEYRAVLGALARSGRALEINTVVPLPAEIARWWHEAGGQAVTFGSDAHDPLAVAEGFSDAAAMAEAAGFRTGRYPHDFWRRNAIR